MATGIFYPTAGSVSPVDGFVRRSNSDLTWNQIRNNATGNEVGVVDTSTLTNFSIYANGITDHYLQLGRIFLCFDASSVGTDITLNSGSIGLRGISKFKDAWTIDDDIHVTSGTPGAFDTLSLADYPKVGTESFGSISYANFITTGYNYIPLNMPGLSNISLTGPCCFVIRWGADLKNTAPTWVDSAQLRANFRLADNAGTTDDPVLIFDYTLNNPLPPSPTPPLPSSQLSSVAGFNSMLHL